MLTALETDVPAAQASQGMSSVEALRRLAESRDPDAWAGIIHAHGARMLNLARRIANDDALADDICQEALLQIRAHAGQFRPPAPSPNPLPQGEGGSGAAEAAAGGWIMRLTCTTAFHMLRSRTRAAHREARAAAPLAVAGCPGDALLASEQGELLRHEVAALPEGLRVPVSMHFFGDVGYPELAIALECSPDAAKKRVQRGVERLRSRLAAGGIMLSAGAVVNTLGSAPVQAAEAVLDSQRLATWQALLHSPATPVLSSAAVLGGTSLMAKYVLSTVAVLLLALCGVQTVRVNSAHTEAQEAHAAAAAAAETARTFEAQLAESRGEIAALKSNAASRNEEFAGLHKRLDELEQRSKNPFAGAPLAGLTRRLITQHNGAPGNVRVEGADGQNVKIVVNGVEVAGNGGDKEKKAADGAVEAGHIQLQGGDVLGDVQVLFDAVGPAVREAMDQAMKDPNAAGKIQEAVGKVLDAAAGGGEKKIELPGGGQMVIRMHGAVGNEQKAVEPPKPPKEDVRDNF